MNLTVSILSGEDHSQKKGNIMKLRLSVFSLLFLFCSVSYAGPFTDKLSICLVEKTTTDDKNKLIRWVFGAMSSHPIVSNLSRVTVETGKILNKDTANLFMELLTNRCKEESEKAIKYEKSLAIQKSFSILGKIAMQGIMSHKNVIEFMSGLDTYLDKDKLKSIAPK
jgi:hypothetical protein